MGLFLERKWPCFILAAYLAFAVAEPLRFVDFGENEPASGITVTQHDLLTGSPVEGEPIISKARGHLFSPQRNGPLRIVMPLGTRDTISVLAQSSLRAVENVNHLTIKNPILLKLRT
jgi:hypothetical protein